MNTIRILTHEFLPKRGGAAVVAAEVAAAASHLGYDVNVYAPIKDESFANSVPYEITEIPNHGTLGWRCRLKTFKLLRTNYREWKNSIIHLVDTGPILACMYARILGFLPPAKRVILTLHGSEILRFARLPHRRFLFQKLLTQVDSIHFLSEACKDLFRAHFSNAENALHVVPGASRSFAPQPTKKNSLNNSSSLVFLTVGRVHPRKGQLAALEALAKLPEDIRNSVEYLVAGPVVDTSYQSKLETYANTHGLNVKFLGEIPETQLADLYFSADVFIMTSVHYRNSIEGFGLVYLEAAAHGLPIIAHKIGGVSEAVREGETAILCSPTNRDALATAIWDLINDSEIRLKMGRAGSTFAKQFSWHKVASKLYQ